MNVPAYPLSTNPEKLVFRFKSFSEGKIISKEIAYVQMYQNSIIYNLALGDYDADGILSDLTISHNHDMEKVLATVAKSMLEFFSIRPNCTIFFTGSTSVRTRLYRIAISNYMNEFKEIFVIYGTIKDLLEEFEPNKSYDSFLITLKKQ
ncbi:MAG: DUF6934 family protein [Cytophagales bacterium]